MSVTASALVICALGWQKHALCSIPAVYNFITCFAGVNMTGNCFFLHKQSLPSLHFTTLGLQIKSLARKENR